MPGPSPPSQPSAQGQQGSLYWGQMGDYTTELDLEHKLIQLQTNLNQFIYAGWSEAEGTASQLKADADTLLGWMAFFVDKNSDTAEKGAERRKAYDAALDVVRRTVSLKVIRTQLDEMAKRFATDARELDFKAKRNRRLKGLRFLVQRFQLGPLLEPKHWDRILNRNLQEQEKKHNFHWRMCYVFACQMVLHKAGVPIILTGAPGLGKGTLGQRMIRTTMKILKQEFNVDLGDYSFVGIVDEHIIFVPRKKDILEMMGVAEFWPEMIDEGYWGAANTDSAESLAKLAGKAQNSNRNRKRLTIWCYQNPTRTTKFLMEAFYTWICKYCDDYAVLMQRSRVGTPKDAWSIKEFLEASTEEQIERALINNPNFVEDFKTKEMPEKAFSYYEDKKNKEQAAYAESLDAKDIVSDSLDAYAVELRKAAKAHAFNAEDPSDVEAYIRTKHPEYAFTRGQIKSIIKRYREYDFAKTLREGKEKEQMAVQSQEAR